MPKTATVAVALALFVLAIALTVLSIAPAVYAASLSDNTSIAVPTDNGTSSGANLTGLMQQYVGFYGNLTLQVRNNTATTNVLYSRNVLTGRLFFLKSGQVFPNEVVNATANSTADAVIGVSGFYSTVYNFDSRQDACGITNVSKLNTTDDRMTGLLSNNTNTQYFFCTDIGSFTSTHGFGTIGYEIVVPKTSTYTAYDIWFDLT